LHGEVWLEPVASVEIEAAANEKGDDQGEVEDVDHGLSDRNI